MLAAARLVEMCAEVLDVRIGFALAARGFVDVSKTMPVPLAAAPGAPERCEAVARYAPRRRRRMARCDFGGRLPAASFAGLLTQIKALISLEPKRLD